jgi:hypothetical protein
MSYSNDPVRWTAHPDDAPDALRAPLEAAGREAPSEQQMKALALKLAAIGVGTAAAASAATAKAAAGTAAVGAKSAGVLTVTKVLASLAVVGAVGAGAVMMRSQSEQAQPRATVAAPATEVSPATDLAPAAPPASPQGAGSAAPSGAEATPFRTETTPSRTETTPSRTETTPSRTEEAPGETRARSRHVATRERTTKRERAHQPAKHRLGVKVVAPAEKIPSEVELLRQARAALASQPREAFALTEQHRQHYARGTFVQERDALAIEALLRTGELDMARDLARRFVRDYPSSPHAHRFREKMGL